MKLQSQVCTPEQAKKLKELGVEQESLFYYVQEKTPTNPNLHLYGYPQENMPIDLFFSKQSDLSTKKRRIHFEYSAFTVAELGIMIDGCFISALNYFNKWEAWPNPNNTNLSDDDYDLPIHGKYDTEAECLAANMIDFINNGILSVDKINHRLKNQ